jgi:hypothetical protein
MDSTTDVLLVKITAVIHDFHLHDITSDPPISLLNLLPAQAQLSNHPFLIVLVQRDRGFALAARAATGAGEDIRQRWWCFFHTLFARLL